MHYCSIFKVLFRCCCLRQLCYINTTCRFLSTTFFIFFETFFNLRGSLETYNGLWFFVVSFVASCRLTTLLSYQSFFLFASTFFIFFKKLFCFVFLSNKLPSKSFFKRRRRDLNPRAAINDLHPFQGCPFNLLGTSPIKLIHRTILSCHLEKRLAERCLQRREWDSNPRALSDKRFSRPPRYDHFDTSPKRSPLVQRQNSF